MYITSGKDYNSVILGAITRSILHFLHHFLQNICTHLFVSEAFHEEATRMSRTMPDSKPIAHQLDALRPVLFHTQHVALVSRLGSCTLEAFRAELLPR